MSDFFAAVGGLFGNSKNGTFNCFVQSFLTNYFPLTSIFWTVVISYLLFDILQKPHLNRKQSMNIERWVHLLCWGFPFLLTVLPLTTTDYGTFDGEDGWCFLRPRTGSPKWTFRFWLFAAFFAWVYIAITIFLIFIVYVAYVVASPSGYLQTDSIITSTIRKAVNKLIWYPVIILLSWFVMTIYELWGGFYPNENSLSDPTFMYFTFTMPLFSGLMTSTAFISGCSEAQQVLFQEWISPLSYRCCKLSLPLSCLFTSSSHISDAPRTESSPQTSSSSTSTISPLISTPKDLGSGDLSHSHSDQNASKIPMSTFADRSSEIQFNPSEP